MFSFRPSLAAEIPLGRAVFTLPDGFEIEVIARPPLVNRPITGAFDEQGRLYVADSSGSNDRSKSSSPKGPTGSCDWTTPTATADSIVTRSLPTR